MFKHRLMLSAARVALVAGTAHADTTINNATTTPLKTSTAGNITIDASGSIKSKSTPLITVDSSNTVTSAGTLNAKDANNGEAYLIDATGGALAGSITDTSALIDLTGSGSGKRIFELKGTNAFTGNLSFGGTAYNVNGDNSVGFLFDSGSVLNGNFTMNGALAMTAASKDNASTSVGPIGIDILGTVNGNVISSGSITGIGENAQGIVLGSTGSISGVFQNLGTISLAGISARSGKKANPESGSAIVINGNVGGGFINGGATLPSGTTPVIVAPSITVFGVSPAIQIAATAANITLGPVSTTYDVSNTFGYSFINHGTVQIGPEDSNQQSSVIGVEIGQISAAFDTTLTNGLLNTGAISASSVSQSNTNTGLANVEAIGFYVGNGATVPTFDNIGAAAGITGAISGPANNGIAYGLLIDTTANVATLNNLEGATIFGSANASDPAITQLTAVALKDNSGTLTTINNSGTITASGSVLNSNTQTLNAIDVSANTSGVTINNGSATGFINHYDPDLAAAPVTYGATAGGGQITGNILFGTGSDTLNIEGATVGANTAQSTVTGNVFFNTASAGTFDALNINNLGVLTGGVISAAGNLDINVAAGGTLNLNNAPLSVTAPNGTITGVPTLVHDLIVTGGATPALSGNFNLVISQPLSTGVIIANDKIVIGHNAGFSLGFASFVSNSTDFVLLDTPANNLTIDDAAIYASNFEQNTPFLYSGSLCTYNVAGSPITCATGTGPANGHSQLVLLLQQKQVGNAPGDLALTGNAAKMYSITNQALVNDNVVGGAVVGAVTDLASAQSVYDQFAPTATGSARAIAVSLTDQATGTIGARQRELRLYGKQPGESTLWGVEFAQMLKDPGDDIPGITANPPTTIATPAGRLTGFKDHGFGFSLGADAGSAKGGWYGGALTFYTGDAGELGDRTGNNTQSEWYMLTGYSDWRGRGLFFDSNLNVGLAQFKGKRNVDLATITRTALNKHTGLLAAGGFTTGAMLGWGGTTFTPQISIDAMTMREEGYTESGAGTTSADAVDLMVKPSYGNSLRGFLGADLRQDVDTGSFFLQPAARLGYRYDFVDGTQKVHANFVSLPGAANEFSILSPDPDRGNLVAGLSLGATTDTWSLNVSYDLVRGSSGAMQQNGQFTLVGRI